MRVVTRLKDMNRRIHAYADFVEHPRYGRGPRWTGMNPRDDLSQGVYLGWHSRSDERIPDTAIEANTDRQPNATVPVTHYFDLKRKCRDCGRSFIFFAEEQRYWYETLQFYLGADCVRCIDCRLAERDTKRLRERYETLLADDQRSDADNLDLAEVAMALIDCGVFGARCLEHVRCRLNSIPAESRVRRHATFRDVETRSAQRLHEGG
jgi:Probable zinc-ribbon domain